MSPGRDEVLNRDLKTRTEQNVRTNVLLARNRPIDCGIQVLGYCLRAMPTRARRNNWRKHWMMQCLAASCDSTPYNQ